MQRNAAGGKGPDFSDGEDEGEREGMAGTAWSNYPRTRERAVKAARWTPDWYHDQGLHQLMGTIRYPKAA